MDGCPKCCGKGYIVFGNDTESSRYTVPCECCSTIGVLYIHRDIPGDHVLGGDCWCNPHRIYEDDPRSTVEIIRDMELAERKQ